MNNSNNWYTQNDVMLLFGYAEKQSVRKLREKVRTTKISNRYLYLRSDIDRLLSEKYTTKREKKLLQLALSKIENSDIDLDVWIPLKDALKIVSFSRQRLYQLKNTGTIDYKVYDGFMLFNKQQLKKLNSD